MVAVGSALALLICIVLLYPRSFHRDPGRGPGEFAEFYSTADRGLEQTDREVQINDHEEEQSAPMGPRMSVLVSHSIKTGGTFMKRILVRSPEAKKCFCYNSLVVCREMLSDPQVALKCKSGIAGFLENETPTLEFVASRLLVEADIDELLVVHMAREPQDWFVSVMSSLCEGTNYLQHKYVTIQNSEKQRETLCLQPAGQDQWSALVSQWPVFYRKPDHFIERAREIVRFPNFIICDYNSLYDDFVALVANLLGSASAKAQITDAKEKVNASNKVEATVKHLQELYQAYRHEKFSITERYHSALAGKCAYRFTSDNLKDLETSSFLSGIENALEQVLDIITSSQ